MQMKLYEFAPTRSIRVRWTLQELGVDFEPIRVNLLAGEHRRPEFLKINPAGKIPVLVDGDLVLTESVAIVLYLADKYSNKGLIPDDLKERAQVNRWLLTKAGSSLKKDFTFFSISSPPSGSRFKLALRAAARNSGSFIVSEKAFLSILTRSFGVPGGIT
jgi:glutathione S-transferase